VILKEETFGSFCFMILIEWVNFILPIFQIKTEQADSHEPARFILSE